MSSSEPRDTGDLLEVPEEEWLERLSHQVAGNTRARIRTTITFILRLHPRRRSR